MRCQDCTRNADLTVDRNGIAVGFCEDHFQERLAVFSRGAWVTTITDELDWEPAKS